jgi:RNA polymerase sigma factor (sigma-70 family)
VSTELQRQTDTDRFNAFYSELDGRITNYVRLLTKGMFALEPDELVQETWLKVWRAMPGQPDMHHGYIFMIARNTTRDAMRRRARYLKNINPLPLDVVQEGGECYADILPDMERDFTEIIESRDDLGPRIKMILARMGKTRRAALVLSTSGYTYEEICSMIGFNANTVKTAYYRGRRAFRVEWEREEK